MAKHAEPPYGEQVISWMTIRDELFPPDDGGQVGHDDAAAREMHRLRGLVLAQAAETEEVLARMVVKVAPRTKSDVPAGALLSALGKALEGRADADQHTSVLEQIDTAIKMRNRCAHDTVHIGSSFREYSTGGGHFEPVISLMGGEMVDEFDLIERLSAQQRATEAAVRLSRTLGCD